LGVGRREVVGGGSRKREEAEKEGGLHRGEQKMEDRR
jgi:hypothetical protein